MRSGVNCYFSGVSCMIRGVTAPTLRPIKKMPRYLVDLAEPELMGHVSFGSGHALRINEIKVW